MADLIKIQRSKAYQRRKRSRFDGFDFVVVEVQRRQQIQVFESLRMNFFLMSQLLRFNETKERKESNIVTPISSNEIPSKSRYRKFTKCEINDGSTRNILFPLKSRFVRFSFRAKMLTSRLSISLFGEIRYRRFPSLWNASGEPFLNFPEDSVFFLLQNCSGLKSVEERQLNFILLFKFYLTLKLLIQSFI